MAEASQRPFHSGCPLPVRNVWTKVLHFGMTVGGKRKSQLSRDLDGIESTLSYKSFIIFNYKRLKLILTKFFYVS